MGRRPGPGLYIHLPFCPSLCPYCDFATQKYRPGQARELIAGLAVHLRRLAGALRGRRLETIYFGGGTPSMWPAAALAGLLELAVDLWGLAPGGEVSLEANPGTLSRGKLKALRAAGFNRLSLGAQSFDPGRLAALGRRHSADDTRRAVDQARAAGFDNLNLDIIYGLPGQDPAAAARDLARALALEPEHLSLYELTLGPETPFGRRYSQGREPLPSEDQVLAMEDAALAALAAAGLERYEVSNFARPGFQCRHNQSTWRGGDYLAAGPGAHGHLDGRRWAYLPQVGPYLASLTQGREPYQFVEDLTPQQRCLELFMLGLRTTAGVELAAVEEILGRDPRQVYAPGIRRLQELGWARLTATHLVPTTLGLRMADAASAQCLGSHIGRT